MHNVNELLPVEYFNCQDSVEVWLLFHLYSVSVGCTVSTDVYTVHIQCMVPVIPYCFSVVCVSIQVYGIVRSPISLPFPDRITIVPKTVVPIDKSSCFTLAPPTTGKIDESVS